MTKRTKRRITTVFVSLGLLALVAVLAFQFLVGSVMRQLMNGRLEEADYWSDKPAILSGGMGFDNIIGLPEIDEATVRDAGGSCYGSLTCTNGEEPTELNRTSAAAAGNLDQGYRGASTSPTMTGSRSCSVGRLRPGPSTPPTSGSPSTRARPSSDTRPG
jgi:hypothetical protein